MHQTSDITQDWFGYDVSECCLRVPITHKSLEERVDNLEEKLSELYEIVAGLQRRK